MSQKHMLSAGILLLAALGHIATSESEAPLGFQEEIQEQTLEGIINGVDWIFGSGIAIYDANDDEFLVRLYAEQTNDPCTLQSSVNKILLTMPNQVGPYALSMEQHTVTLVEDRQPDPPMNFIATEGEVEIYGVEIDSISAGMAVYVDDNTWVNGTFDITVCE